MDSSVRHSDTVLRANDPPASRTLNPDSRRPVLFVCDHASNVIPPSLNDLGLGPHELGRHIAFDKGSAALTERLCEQLNFMAVLCNYSRLVIDCNRRIEDPTYMPLVSDDVTVPGNHDLTPVHRQARYDEIYVPYHAAITDALDCLEQDCPGPAVVAIHSFTPKLETGVQRPWHVGVLWDQDPRIADRLKDYLQGFPSLCVGDNEPYSGKHMADYTIDHHGEGRRLPCVSIEIRQDTLNSEDGVSAWADRLVPFFRALETDTTLFKKRL
ncbi:MAG: N-formylglutamate amidohydrolase [Pseudomonadota bacterium]